MFTLYDEEIEKREQFRQTPLKLPMYPPTWHNCTWYHPNHEGNHIGLHMCEWPPCSPTHDEVNYSHEEGVKMLKKMIEGELTEEELIFYFGTEEHTCNKENNTTPCSMSNDDITPKKRIYSNDKKYY